MDSPNRHGESPQQLTAKQAAGRLGIKRETLYAYVSRGMLARQKVPGSRESYFDPVAVERLAAKKRGTGRAGSVEVIIGTALTSIEQWGVSYRGLPAADLAESRSFESVAEWLWGLEFPSEESGSEWRASRAASEAGRAVQLALPDAARPMDRIHATLAVIGPTDALRFDVSPDAVVSAGRGSIAALVDSLPLLGTANPRTLAIDEQPARENPLAARLWPRLSAFEGSDRGPELLNAALVLGADHELAASTLAARVAASVRADPYSILSAGFGVLAGPLHGGASGQVHRLLCEVGRPENALPVLTEHFRREKFMPGFGHLFYQREDPRAVALLSMLRRSNVDPSRLAAVEAVLEVLKDRLPVFMNVDFALAALAFCGRMCDGAPEAIFGVARCAGWLAHAIEEYRERPVRFRPRAHYLGPAPAT
jgi:citrate synthase